MHELMAMLSVRRPAWSKSEWQWIADWLLPIPGTRVDAFGNVRLQIGESPVLWSAHTDTVARTGGRQSVAVDAKGIVRLSGRSLRTSNCLGADNTAGVWLLRELALAGVPGLYIWHRDEESGGRGSQWIADNAADSLSAIRYAIAIDRRGRDSFVTHHCCRRTACDSFAAALGARLGSGYKADPNGVFTDTERYADLIPECTNLSGGTANEHCQSESLDTGHLFRLRDTLLRIGPELASLPADRTPCEDDYHDSYRGAWLPRGTGEIDVDLWTPPKKGKRKRIADWTLDSRGRVEHRPRGATKERVEDWLTGDRPDRSNSFVRLIKANAATAADVLDSWRLLPATGDSLTERDCLDYAAELADMAESIGYDVLDLYDALLATGRTVFA